ncbi:hypothetical protein [uncultured Nostoc sp.]|uniref:hypothetical protein n=1 Tax=uncultured Nostoc sp. TaxID=340711 RepID=UPI0035CA0F08
MAIKILELSTLTVLTEEELKSCKGGGETPPVIVDPVGSITKAVGTTIDNTTSSTLPLTISGVQDAVKLTTDAPLSVIETT